MTDTPTPDLATEIVQALRDANLMDNALDRFHVELVVREKLRATLETVKAITEGYQLRAEQAEADIERLRADYTTVRDAVLGHQPRDWSAREVAALAAAHRSDSEDRDAQEALRASHVAPSDPKSDDETCARCSHPRLWHAGNGREMGECQVHSGCSCYEFLAPVAGHAAPAPPARKVQRDVVMTAIRTCCREKRFGLIGREIDALTQAIVDAYAEPSGEPAAPPSEKGKP